MLTQLSKYFTLEELTTSAKAKELGVSNIPTGRYRQNVELLAVEMDKVREILGYPVLVSCGYRRSVVNTAVGGSDTSAHLFGLAADFVCPKFGSVIEVARKLAASGLVFDQLIYERIGGKEWIHIGYPTGTRAARKQVLTGVGKGKYLQGIVPA